MRGIIHTMCGRATLTTPPEDLVELFGIEPPTVQWPARYNIAPTQPVAVIRGGPDRKRSIGLMRWGLIPSFARDSSIGGRMINVRVESLERRDVFRGAFASRRCLVVVDGFYEWTHAKPRRTPHYVRRADGKPMALAALWDSWRSPSGEVVESCAIVTIPASPPVSALHDRMPLLVPTALFDRWLDPAATREDLAPLLAIAVGEGELVAYAVDSKVNSPINDGPENIVPFEGQRTLFG
jgi:putative SOS response-associated peptidase YedK